MLRCGCGMMIECEVKTGQTVKFIEHIRRDGCQLIVIESSRKDEKVRKKEGRGMRDNPVFQDLQKHLKEGRRDCWNKEK